MEALRYRMAQLWSSLVEVSLRRSLTVMCLIGLATVPRFTEGKQQIAVPSYVYPCSGCAWQVFETGATIVIINPNSGPVYSDNFTLGQYQDLVSTVKNNSTVTTVLGYVLTGYTQRDSALVLSDIDNYYHNFSTKIDGIFLDEGNNSCAATTRYKLYDDRVKSNWGSSGFTALNWGTAGPECFLQETNIDTFCTYEGSYSDYISAAYSGSPAWVFNYSASYFWHIVYLTPNDAPSVQNGVSLSKTRNAGNIYFTDANPANNAYNVSPSTTVWQTEVAQAANQVAVFSS